MSGLEWKLLHEVKEEKAGLHEEREDKKDPWTPDIPNSFMYADREEVMMEGAEAVKAHNIIGGDKKNRSKS